MELTKKMDEFLDKVEDGNASWITFVKGVHGKMGFARPTQRAVGGSGGVYPPTLPQLKYAQSLSKQHEKPIPDDAMKSSRTMSAYIKGLLDKG